jgi:hypothetical protein
MPVPPPGRIPPLRLAALPLLVAFVLALFVAALPSPVRPQWLALPNLATNVFLRLFAVRAGISVFEPPRERIVDVLRNDCIRVRGLRASAAPETLQPPDGRCVTSGVRLGVPLREWMLRSILTGGEAGLTEIQRESVIGDWFCFAPPWRDRRFEQIELVWTQPTFHIDTGAEKVTNVLFFRWRCDPPGLVGEARGSSDAELRHLTGGS